MRSICFTVTACILANASFAQISFFAKPKETFRFQNILTAPKNASNSKTIILPQDNMPCQVTDVTAIAAMPNAVSSFDNSTMPNASPKQQPALIQPVISDAYAKALLGSIKGNPKRNPFSAR